jgi:hypothetical protein
MRLVTKAEMQYFKQNGRVALKYGPDIGLAITRAMESWEIFCSLPKDVRKKFPYFPEDGMGVGYELKEIQGKTLDIKEDFHFTQVSRDELRSSAGKVSSEAVTFVARADELALKLEPAIEAFAAGLEKHLQCKGIRSEVEDGRWKCFLRFLHYFGGSKPGDEIAKAHADKSGFTLHLYESDPGLQYLGRKGEWHDMVVHDGHMVVIPNMQLQLRSRGELKATYHRVVANDETANQGRFSMVCFVPLVRTSRYNKGAVGRIQDLQPGFNYTIPFEEFQKLFV